MPFYNCIGCNVLLPENQSGKCALCSAADKPLHSPPPSPPSLPPPPKRKCTNCNGAGSKITFTGPPNIDGVSTPERTPCKVCGGLGRV